MSSLALLSWLGWESYNLILINVYGICDGNLFSNMVTRESKQDGWIGMMVIWFWYIMGFPWVSARTSLDSKDRFMDK